MQRYSYIEWARCCDLTSHTVDEDEVATPVATANTAINGMVHSANGVDDELVEWLSSCDTAQDDVLHKVSINNETL